MTYCFIDFLNTKNYSDDFASGPTAVEAIILIAFSIYYLFEQIDDTHSIFIYSKKSFWIVVASIVYLSGTFFLFIFAEKMMVDDVFARQYALMNSWLYIIKNCIISIGFIIDNGETLELHHSNTYGSHYFESLREE